MRLITTNEVAELLRRDPSTLRRWRTARPVQGPPFIKLTNRVTLYDVEDVYRWLAAHRVEEAA